MLHSLIMAGGSGTRFWPLSRQALPKQFLTFDGDRSLIQQTFDRCQPWIPAERTWVATNRSLGELTAQHLPSVPPSQILQEPRARNTTACIAWAAACLAARDPSATMLVMPADHIIGDSQAFAADVQKAVKLVEENPRQLVLFGVPPSYPATGFGYIEQRGQHADGICDVSGFREKPDLQTAEQYVQSGRSLWNCGIFVWKASAILQALGEWEPCIAATFLELASHLGTEDWDDRLAQAFNQVKSISIDHSVLEFDQHLKLVRASFSWDDVGGWESLARLLPADEHQNHFQGSVVAVDSRQCLVRTEAGHLVTLLGMQDCIVVQTPEATLVARRGDDEAIREVIAALREQDQARYL